MELYFLITLELHRQGLLAAAQVDLKYPPQGKKKKKGMHVVRWSSDKMCPGKQECWVAASPGAAAGVDAQ